jgi:hypothetical protein
LLPADDPAWNLVQHIRFRDGKVVQRGSEPEQHAGGSADFIALQIERGHPVFWRLPPCPACPERSSAADADAPPVAAAKTPDACFSFGSDNGYPYA